VFLGFYLSFERRFIMQGKFSCVPGDSHMGSPSSVFIGSGDCDYIVLIRDVFHFEQTDAANWQDSERVMTEMGKGMD
jgi:hypothetical protein